MNEQRAPHKGGRGARQRILDAATELFYLDGINATGVEKLAAESSVSKRTLYQHFPSKTAVVEEYLRGIEEHVAQVAVQQDDRTPRQRLLASFDRTFTPGASFRGCPFHNAAVEAAGTMPGVADIVRTSKLGFADRLTELAELAVLYEGAGALATSLNDPAPWARAKKAAEVLIYHALDA